jgi:hypothetical protein
MSRSKTRKKADEFLVCIKTNVHSNAKQDMLLNNLTIQITHDMQYNSKTV